LIWLEQSIWIRDTWATVDNADLNPVGVGFGMDGNWPSTMVKGIAQEVPQDLGKPIWIRENRDVRSVDCGWIGQPLHDSLQDMFNHDRLGTDCHQIDLESGSDSEVVHHVCRLACLICHQTKELECLLLIERQGTRSQLLSKSEHSGERSA
jgi:hypothetical protein